MVTDTNHIQNSLTKVLLLTIFLISLSCKSTPTGPHITANLQLTKDYVTCTEVWVKIVYSGQLSVNSGQSTVNSRYLITRDGDTVLTGMLAGTDTVVIDTTAQPATVYTYRGYRISNGQVADTSGVLQVTTLNTTSDNFTWQTYTFGGNDGSSILKDVTVLNDTAIWAVGTIAPDSVSQNLYNAICWDGRCWRLVRVNFYGICGEHDSSSYRSYPSTAVFALSSVDIRITGAGQVAQWNSHSQSEPECIGFSINRLSGNGTSNLYAVGDGGNVSRFSGGSWNTLPRATSLDVNDIWQASDSVTGQEEILAVASDQFTDDGVAVLSISGTQVIDLQNSGLPTTSIVGVWSAEGREWYVCGDGLYKTRDLNVPWQQVKGIPSIYTEAIRGNGPNDIFAVGDFGLVLHFNGTRWTNCSNQFTLPSNPVLYAVSVKGNTIVAVGAAGSPGDAPAIILVGRRK